MTSPAASQNPFDEVDEQASIFGPPEARQAGAIFDQLVAARLAGRHVERAVVQIGLRDQLRSATPHRELLAVAAELRRAESRSLSSASQAQLHPFAHNLGQMANALETAVDRNETVENAFIRLAQISDWAEVNAGREIVGVLKRDLGSGDEGRRQRALDFMEDEIVLHAFKPRPLTRKESPHSYDSILIEHGVRVDPLGKGKEWREKATVQNSVATWVALCDVDRSLRQLQRRLQNGGASPHRSRQALEETGRHFASILERSLLIPAEFRPKDIDVVEEHWSALWHAFDDASKPQQPLDNATFDRVSEQVAASLRELEATGRTYIRQQIVRKVDGPDSPERDNVMLLAGRGVTERALEARHTFLEKHGLSSLELRPSPAGVRHHRVVQGIKRFANADLEVGREMREGPWAKAAFTRSGYRSIVDPGAGKSVMVTLTSTVEVIDELGLRSSLTQESRREPTPEPQPSIDTGDTLSSDAGKSALADRESGQRSRGPVRKVHDNGPPGGIRPMDVGPTDDLPGHRHERRRGPDFHPGP